MSDPRFMAAISSTPDEALALARAYEIPAENAVSDPDEVRGRVFDGYVADFVLSDKWNQALAPCFATRTSVTSLDWTAEDPYALTYRSLDLRDLTSETVDLLLQLRDSVARRVVERLNSSLKLLLSNR